MIYVLEISIAELWKVKRALEEYRHSVNNWMSQKAKLGELTEAQATDCLKQLQENILDAVAKFAKTGKYVAPRPIKARAQQ